MCVCVYLKVFVCVVVYLHVFMCRCVLTGVVPVGASRRHNAVASCGSHCSGSMNE